MIQSWGVGVVTGVERPLQPADLDFLLDVSFPRVSAATSGERCRWRAIPERAARTPTRLPCYVVLPITLPGSPGTL